MGQKVHPTGFRIGIIYDWQSKWFAERDYHKFLREDILIRAYLEESMKDASVAKVEIERNANVVTVTIHTAKPGIVIGRGGQKVDELRGKLESLTGKRIRVNIQEIRMPELDARLVDLGDLLLRQDLDAEPPQRPLRRRGELGGEGVEDPVVAFHEDDARLRRVDGAELLAEGVACDLAERAGELDARRSSAHDDEGEERGNARWVRLALRRLERA